MNDRLPEFVLSPEVDAARRAGAPLAALESTLISHGLPYPDNIEVAARGRGGGARRRGRSGHHGGA